MKKKHLKKPIKYMVIGLVIVLITVTIVILKPSTNKQSILDSSNEVEEMQEEYPYLSTWNEYHVINDDYIGTIQFESGLIDLPFVQGSDNTTYFRTNWQTMEYDDEGSIFLDSSNSLHDQNLILIGHYVYESVDPTRTHMFTPLSLLTSQENYEANKLVKLYLENEIREYVIAYVYECPLIYEETDGDAFYYAEDGYEFYYPNYTEDEFNQYINTIKENSYYDTGVEVSYTDSLLTLQTCIENVDDKREIVVLKEVNRTEYK